ACQRRNPFVVEFWAPNPAEFCRSAPTIRGGFRSGVEASPRVAPDRHGDLYDLGTSEPLRPAVPIADADVAIDYRRVRAGLYGSQRDAVLINWTYRGATLRPSAAKRVSQANAAFGPSRTVVLPHALGRQ